MHSNEIRLQSQTTSSLKTVVTILNCLSKDRLAFWIFYFLIKNHTERWFRVFSKLNVSCVIFCEFINPHKRALFKTLTYIDIIYFMILYGLFI